MLAIRGVVVCLFAFVLVFVGPSAEGEAGARSRGGRIDPCDLLSRDAIRRITGWRMPRGTRAIEHRAARRAVCNFTEPHLAGMVHIQLYEGGGKRAFDRRRAATERQGMGRGRAVKIRDARAAYEIPAHGVVGLLVDRDFAQVVTIGPGVRDREQRRIAAVVARNLR